MHLAVHHFVNIKINIKISWNLPFICIIPSLHTLHGETSIYVLPPPPAFPSPFPKSGRASPLVAIKMHVKKSRMLKWKLYFWHHTRKVSTVDSRWRKISHTTLLNDFSVCVMEDALCDRDWKNNLLGDDRYIGGIEEFQLSKEQTDERLIHLSRRMITRNILTERVNE